MQMCLRDRHYTMPEGIFRLPRFWKEERVMHERAMELLSIFHMEHLSLIHI